MKLKKVKWCQKMVNIPGVALNDYNSETAFHIYCADWLRKQFELTGEERFTHWHHSANERSNAREGQRSKLMGQSRGWPDLVHMSPPYMAIELKIPGGLVGVEQKRWLEHFKSIGWTAEVVTNFERFCEVVLAA